MEGGTGGAGSVFDTLKKYFSITNLLLLPIIFIVFYFGGLIWHEGGNILAIGIVLFMIIMIFVWEREKRKKREKNISQN